MRTGPIAGAELARLTENVASVVGRDAVELRPAQLAPFSPNGAPPLMVASPSTAQELGAVVAAANRAGVALIPWGGGTKQAMGDYAPPAAIVASLCRLDRILEIDAGNQTVRAQAGVPLAALDHALRAQGLRLPLDPDDSESATIGGTIACNANGPSRLRYGTVRDFVLGLKVVMPTGEVIRIGGQTVKDVAGYDLKKLMIGAWGTLGIVVEAVLRLLPVPEATAASLYQFPNACRATEFTAALLRSQLLPSGLELMDRHAGSAFLRALGRGRSKLKDEAALVLIGFEGMAEDVRFQRPAIDELARQHGGAAIKLSDAPAETVWASRRRVRRILSDEAGEALQLKVSVPLAKLPAMWGTAREVAGGHGLALSAVAHAGSGIVYFTLPARSEKENEAVPAALAQLAAAASGFRGFLLVERCPIELRARLPVAANRDDFRLMRALKATLDPEGVLNPGRLSWIGL